MPSEHARLSPSAASRWLACPASVRMSAEVPDQPDSPYAREGTLAHTRAEIEAGLALGLAKPHEHRQMVKLWQAQVRQELATEQMDDIETHARAYAQLLVDKVAARPGTVVFLEQRVFPGVPSCFGTGDAVLVSPDGHIEIVDFKYGAGVRVSATDNPQLKLYGLGALEEYGDVVATTTEVTCTIYQPRVHVDVSSHTVAAADLRAWRDTVVLPKAAEALSDTAAFNPGETQCRWCPAAGICRPRMEAATDEDFSADPDILTDAELGELMGRLPAIEEWAAAVRSTVLRKLYEQGHPVPGWKAVRSNGRRTITDADTATDRLAHAGWPRDLTTDTKPKTLGELEKLVGKDRLAEVLGDVLKKSEGNPAVARESDPRPAISKLAEARTDFEEDQ